MAFNNYLDQCYSEKCGVVRNEAAEAYMKLVVIQKKGAYCEHYKNMGGFENLGKCISKVIDDTEQLCAGGDGFFAYDGTEGGTGWCSCCTNSDDALTATVETES